MTTKESDIAEAKKYILRRMEYQRKAEASIEKYMILAAEKIYDISIRYNIPPKQFQFSDNPKLEQEVNEVLQWLREALAIIIERAVLAASENEEDHNQLLAYMSGTGGEYTIEELIAVYVGRYKYELEAFLAAGFAYNLSKSDLIEEIRLSFGKPYASRLLQRAFKDDGFNATRIRSKGITYGVGQYKSSKNSIDRLESATVGIVWWLWQGKKIKESGAQFFAQMRGSDYPCHQCDDEVGIYPIDEIGRDYPHAHCYCFRVPIYE
jgi:hypothetical protein